MARIDLSRANFVRMIHRSVTIPGAENANFLPVNCAAVGQPSWLPVSAGILARRTLGRQGCRPNRQAGSLPYDRTVHQYAASFWEWRANERGRSNSLTE